MTNDSIYVDKKIQCFIRSLNRLQPIELFQPTVEHTAAERHVGAVTGYF